MKSARAPLATESAKAPTGITGLDDITGGGLPRGRATLLVGGPGSGKTVLALQFLVHGAQHCKEPGIFVACEENGQRIVANATSFGWKLAELQRKKLFFLDAQPPTDLVQAGDFDLGGMLAALDAKTSEMGARRIVFDSLDVALALLPDQAARSREIYRLHAWLLTRQLSAIITAKADDEPTHSIEQQPFRAMLFMVDCALILKHRVLAGVSRRDLRVQKYRGSGFDEDEAPFVIGNSGIEVAVAPTRGHVEARVSNERVSSGVERFDTMLGGGYFRGASVLITGSAGTGKSTLSGAFAEAACQRGEPTTFVSFDSDAPEVIRNLASVGIRLDPYVKNGCLRMISARGIAGSADTYLERIKALAGEHGARCLVIDPMSTWSKSGNAVTAHSVADRLIDWAKAKGITLLCTRLIDDMFSNVEAGSPLQVSTLVDTWVHLNYLVQGGERNRGLAIIKSRGTAHSNQVRELILSDAGVTLADTYTAGGEVLMGTLRWEKENAERVATEAAEAAARLQQVKLEAEEAELAARLQAVQTELVAKQVEKALLTSTTQNQQGELQHGRSRMQELRGADASKPRRKASPT